MRSSPRAGVDDNAGIQFRVTNFDQLYNAHMSIYRAWALLLNMNSAMPTACTAWAGSRIPQALSQSLPLSRQRWHCHACTKLRSPRCNKRLRTTLLRRQEIPMSWSFVTGSPRFFCTAYMLSLRHCCL